MEKRSESRRACQLMKRLLLLVHAAAGTAAAHLITAIAS